MIRKWLAKKIRNWILTLKFVEEAMALAVALGKREGSLDAFEKAREDLEETNIYDVDTKAEELAKKKLNDLLSPVDLNSVVTLNKTQGVVYIGGQRADETRLANLKAEAEALLNFDIWKLIYESPKALAEKQMFVVSESLDDLKKGKSILYTLSVQKNIIDILKSFVPRS